MSNNVSENCAVCEIMWNNTPEPDRAQITIQYDQYQLRARYLKLQTHTQNMLYLMLSHCNDSCTNALRFYFKLTLAVWL
jgi:hypothetical protein